MDVISAVTAAGALLSATWAISQKLYRLVESSREVDQTITMLQAEVTSFAQSIGAVKESLRDPGIDQNERHPVWGNLNQRVDACAVTIRAFNEKLENILVGRGPLQDMIRQFRLNFREEDIRNLRSQIQSHNSAMQIMLLVISVHITSSTRVAAAQHSTQLDRQNRKLDTLIRQLRTLNLDANLQTSDSVDRPIIEANEVLRMTAREVVSSASVVAPSEPAMPGDRDLMSNIDEEETTGSEFGDPMNPDGVRRVQTWMTDGRPNPTETFLSPPNTSLSTNSSVGPATPCEGSNELSALVGSAYPEDPNGLEDERDMDLMLNYIAIGKEKHEAKSYPEAEKYFRRAIDRGESPEVDATAMSLMPVKLLLAEACMHQNKYEAAQRISEELVQGDLETPTKLDASMLLSRILFRKGDLDSAKQQCKKTRRGWEREEGKTSTGYYQATALMAAISAYEDDEVEAAAYARILPDNFRAPRFEPPRPISHQRSISSIASKTMMRASVSAASTSGAEGQREFLRRHSYDPSAKKSAKNGPKALLWAAHDGCIAIVQHLLSLGIPVNGQVDLEEPSPRNGTFTGMLNRRTTPNIAMINRGISPLHAACGNAEYDMVECLLRAGANPRAVADNDYKPKPLHYAARSADARIVEMLVNEGVDVNAPRAQGITPLMDAATAGHLPVMRMLLDFGAVPYTKDGNGCDALDHACSGKPSIHTVAFLLRHRLSVNSRDGHQRTPMHRIAQHDNAHLVDILVQHGANLEPTNDGGHMPIHVAAWHGHAKVIEQLVDNGADVDARTSYGDTALHLAAHQGKAEAVQVLVRKGANTKLKGRDGRMAESLAIGSTGSILRSIRKGA